MIQKITKILILLIIFSTSCNTNEENDNKQAPDIFEQLTQQQNAKQTPVNHNIKFTASAENIVELGEIFQLTFSINEDADNFTPPSFTNFELVSGPYTSSSSSIQIMNGKTNRNVTNTYTYSLSCQAQGNYTIAPAEIIISGNTYKSNSVQIKVIGNASQNNNTNSIKNKIKQNQINSNKEIFLKTTYSATNVYKGEYFIATTKIYTRKDFQNISEVKFPDYKEFWSEVLEAPRQISFKNELIGGKVYQVALLKQTLLFAQNPGNFTISPYEINLQVKKKDGKTRDFFGRIVDKYKLINKKIKTKKQVITVRPLPQPVPENFSGISGTNITVESSIDNTNIKTDESANLKIVISGSGNLYMLNDLKLQLPEGIEHFKPKIEKSEKYSEKGVFIQKNFNYIIVGNKTGTYNIPINFIYFDTESETYKTISAQKLTLNVEKGEGYVPSQNNPITGDNKDIRFIKTNTKLHKLGDSFAGSVYYWIILASIILIYVIVLTIRKKYIEKNKDIIKVKKKNANKVSQKRLKTALKYLNENKKQDFYKEILTSIWGYLSDKMTVNSDELTNESIQVLLKEKNVNDETIKKLMNVVELCGYAQYSPAIEDAKPENIYKETENVINKLENSL